MVIDTGLAQALVESLGDNNALILRNHWPADDRRHDSRAFNAMHRLELSCKTQIAAMSCNTKLIEVPADVVDATYMNYQPACPPAVRPARLACAAAQTRSHRSELSATTERRDSSLRAFAAIACGYWTAPGYRAVAWSLTAGMVAFGAINVGIALWLNIWDRDFFNALEKRDTAELAELLYILAAIVVSAASRWPSTCMSGDACRSGGGPGSPM